MGQSQSFVQISMLNTQFWSGDGRLESCTVDLGEDERASTCQFKFYDPNLQFSSYLFQLSQASGSITYPSNLLQAPEAAPSPSPSPSTVTPSPGTTPSPTPTPSETPAPSTAGVEGETSTGLPLSAAPEGTRDDALAKYIVQYCNHPKIGVTSANHQAYILATCQHESVMGKYTEEIGKGSGSDYGKTGYWGRGLVQLTWENNYKKAGDKLGVNFVGTTNRELVKQLKYAIPILVIGMRDGWFTGKKLSDYTSFTSMRAIVNGSDQASKIAGYAETWLTKIPKLTNYSQTAIYLANSLATIPEKIPAGSYQIPSQLNSTNALAVNVPTTSTNAPMGQGGRAGLSGTTSLPTYSSFYAGQNYIDAWVYANFAILDTIAKAVGTYDLGTNAFKFIEGGGTVSGTDHPGGGKRAGKYLIDEATWKRVKLINTAIKDFDDDGQTAAAIQLLKEKGDYLNDLKAAKYAQILGYASKFWAEMPGGNREKLNAADALAFFNQRLATSQSSNSSATPSPAPTPSTTPSPTPAPTPVPVDPTPGQGLPGRALTKDEMVKFCTPGVLFVFSRYKSDDAPNDPAKDKLFKGTAFIVEPSGVFVTVGHNWGLDAQEQGKLRQLYAQFKSDYDKTGTPKSVTDLDEAEADYRKATFLHIDNSTDLAIGRLDTPGTYPVLQVAQNFDLKVGDLLYCQGFSNEEGDRPWDIPDGNVSKLGSATGKPTSDALYNGQFETTGDLANSGDSGAPCWDKRGVVYGVHSNSPKEGEGADILGYETRSDVIRSFFKSKMGRDIPAPVIGQTGGSTPSSPRGSQEFTGNGVPIRVAIGHWDSPNAKTYDFFYTAIDVDLSGLPMVTISGKSIKWNITKAAVGQTYSGASLFDIATAITASNNIPLTIKGDIDPTIPYAIQDTDDRTFLHKLANEHGYRLREYDGEAELVPQAQATDSAFIVTYGMSSGLSFSDAADSTRIILRDSFADLGKKKAPQIDIATGQIEYPQSIESVLPSTTIPPDGTRIGKGYPASVDLQLTQQTLALFPGNLIWLDYSLAPNPFARDWRVDRVTHSIDSSGSRTTLSIYLPVWIKQQAGSSGASSSGSSSGGSGGSSSSGGSISGEKLTPQQISDKYANAVIYIKGEQGIGTGYVVTAEGHFLTCNHVMAASGTITLKAGGTVQFSVLGSNKDKDITVGKLNSWNDVYCPLATDADAADPYGAAQGSTLTAIGHPSDRKWTVTSAKRTGSYKCVYTGNQEIDCIQAESTLVSPGNSGGPIFNEYGVVVGMAESEDESQDGAIKAQYIRTYFSSVASGVTIPDPSVIVPSVTPSPSPSPSPIPTPTPTGTVNQKIMAALNELGDFSSANAAGTNGGRLACCWAVNQVISKAGFKKLGESQGNTLYVPTAEKDLGIRGTQITKAQVTAGTICISGGQNHIGIAISPTQIKSNSSSAAKFKWISDLEFGGTYSGATKFYNLNG